MHKLSNTHQYIPYRVSTRMKIPMFTTHLSFAETQQSENGCFWSIYWVEIWINAILMLIMATRWLPITYFNQKRRKKFDPRSPIWTWVVRSKGGRYTDWATEAKEFCQKNSPTYFPWFIIEFQKKNVQWYPKRKKRLC